MPAPTGTSDRMPPVNPTVGPELGDDAGDVAAPVRRHRCGVGDVERDVARAGHLGRGEHDPVALAPPVHRRAHRDRHGQAQPTGVVGVLADEVDAPRGEGVHVGVGRHAGDRTRSVLDRAVKDRQASRHGGDDPQGERCRALRRGARTRGRRAAAPRHGARRAAGQLGGRLRLPPGRPGLPGRALRQPRRRSLDALRRRRHRRHGHAAGAGQGRAGRRALHALGHGRRRRRPARRARHGAGARRGRVDGRDDRAGHGHRAAPGRSLRGLDHVDHR